MSQIEEAKKVAKLFLYMDMEPTAYTPIVVQHPFFESAFLCDNDGVFNALEDEERYYKYLQMYSIKLDSLTDIQSLLSFVRKSYRLTYLKFLVDRKVITIKECGNLLARAWDLIECLHFDTNVSKNTVLKWIKSADKNVLMDVREQAVYNAFGDIVTIYRGCKDIDSAKAISWTLSLETAQWFAIRFNNGYKVFTAKIEKKHIIGYLARRNEQEVLVDYKYLQDIKEYEM